MRRVQLLLGFCCGVLAACGSAVTALGDASILAWGDNSFGQLGIPQPNQGFIAIAAGEYHSLGLRADGSIAAWGKNEQGQCDVPPPNAGFIAVAAGFEHSLGLKSDGSIIGWGNNAAGQCNAPEPNTGFVAVAAGGNTGFGLRADSSIVGWGQNDWGQVAVPEPNANWIAVAGGAHYSMGLKAEGSIVTWGGNFVGQCDVPEPNSGFLAIAAGYLHGLGLKQDGSIVAWGDYSELPSSNGGFTAIAAGWYHSLALRDDGTAAAWSQHGATDVDPLPNQGIVAIIGGRLHGLALTTEALATSTALYVPAEFATIELAFAAATSGDSILISPGVYKEHGLACVPNLTIIGMGGNPGDVVVDADHQGRILDLISAGSIRIENLTLRDGVADEGGAIYCYNSSLRLNRVDLRDNIASESGGGIYLHAVDGFSGEVDIVQSRFVGNHAGAEGGGINAWAKRASLTIRLVAGEFRANSTDGNGGGLGVESHSSSYPPHTATMSLLADGCLFWDNSCGGNGGAVWAEAISSTRHGPSTCTTTITNGVFSGNQALAGGGFGCGSISPNSWDYSYCDATLENSAFWNNSASTGGAAYAYEALSSNPCVLTLRNAIISSTPSGTGVARSGDASVSVSCCDFFANLPSNAGEDLPEPCGSAGNFCEDPLFCDAPAGAFELAIASPCCPENNSCGVLIGALGTGCDAVPVALSSFTLTETESGVQIDWLLAEPAEAVNLRLTAVKSIGGEVQVPFAPLGMGGLAWRALDDRGELAGGGIWRYTLYSREGDSATWAPLRSETIALDGSTSAVLSLSAHPNPFNPIAHLRYALPKSGPARLVVYDLSGRELICLNEGTLPTGQFVLTWDGRDAAGQVLPSGVYFARLELPGQSVTTKLVMLR